MLIRIILGLGVTVIGFGIAGRRFHWLSRLIRSGQPAPDRTRGSIIPKVEAETVEVAGQRKLLQWTVPGLAHFFTMWGFTVLLFTILEAYGALFDRDFFIPLIGHWQWIGFLEDFFAVAVLISLGVFTVIRIQNAPAEEAAPVPLLRLAHRRGLGRPGHDRRGHGHPDRLPGRPDQHRELPLRLVGLRLPRRGQSGCSRSGRA